MKLMRQNKMANEYSNHCLRPFWVFFPLMRVEGYLWWILAFASLHIASIFFLEPCTPFFVSPLYPCLRFWYHLSWPRIFNLLGLLLNLILIWYLRERMKLEFQGLWVDRVKIRVKTQRGSLCVECVDYGGIVKSRTSMVYHMFLFTPSMVN